MFARPEKDNRPHIFGLLNVQDGKSLVLEVSVASNELKEEWISALKAANTTYDSPRKSARKSNGKRGNGELGNSNKDKEVFCGVRRGSDGVERDCQCIMS